MSSKPRNWVNVWVSLVSIRWQWIATEERTSNASDWAQELLKVCTLLKSSSDSCQRLSTWQCSVLSVLHSQQVQRIVNVSKWFLIYNVSKLFQMYLPQKWCECCCVYLALKVCFNPSSQAANLVPTPTTSSAAMSRANCHLRCPSRTHPVARLFRVMASSGAQTVLWHEKRCFTTAHGMPSESPSIWFNLHRFHAPPNIYGPVWSIQSGNEKYVLKILWFSHQRRQRICWDFRPSHEVAYRPMDSFLRLSNASVVETSVETQSKCLDQEPCWKPWALIAALKVPWKVTMEGKREAHVNLEVDFKKSLHCFFCKALLALHFPTTALEPFGFVILMFRS